METNKKHSKKYFDKKKKKLERQLEREGKTPANSSTNIVAGDADIFRAAETKSEVKVAAVAAKEQQVDVESPICDKIAGNTAKFVGSTTNGLGLTAEIPCPVEKVTASFAEISKASAKTPVKKWPSIARGTIGQPGFVQVNYLTLNMDTMPDVAYHYDINIEPNHPKKFMRPVFEEFRRQNYKDYGMAFDGQHSFYAAKKLPDDYMEQTLEITLSSPRTMVFHIRVQLTTNHVVSLNSLHSYYCDRIYDKPMRALQCLEVVLAAPCHERSVRSGRAFYTQPDKLYDLGQFCEMWTGMYQAVMLGDKPFMNIDITHKPFSTQCHLIDYLHTSFKMTQHNRLLGRNEYKQFNEHVRGLCVTYVPPSVFNSNTKNYHVNEVTELAAENLFFKKDDDERSVSVAAYFLSLGCRLKYPKLNCLHVGSKEKTIYLPIEFCSIARGQPLSATTATMHSQQMIRYSATSTTERKKKIMLMLKYFDHNAHNTIAKFGLSIGSDFITVPMRVLRSPQIEYFARETIFPGNGSWHTKDMTKFLVTKRPPSGHKWAIIFSTTGNCNFSLMQHLGSMIVSASRRLNMALQDKPRVLQFDNITRVLGDLKRESYDLVVTVLPRNGITYADVKKVAELDFGILTQCIKEETVERRLNPQLVYNLMLKVNAKLNGTNHKIAADGSVPLKNVMFLGADVSHPSPDQSQIPSVVGVVGSHDPFGACYNMQYRLQKPTLECIERMEELSTHHLKIYFERQGRWPDHLIYYRDGVSDGQFPLIKESEIGGIRWACKKLHINVKITCVIVVKRHHTRFFPQTATRGDRFNNVVPGTVVDRIIVHPNEVQFFMVSHQSVQGTVKPTRYNVIVNDGNLDINLLQTLTYNLCHMFPRCNRPVSCPTPAYLAHLVASRGRIYIDGTALQPRESDKQYETRSVEPFFAKANPMYFV